MNWNLLGRGAVATLVSAALGLGTTACSRDYTVAFVYATAATNTTEGVVDGYQVDYQSGALTQLANSPTDSGGRNPVSLVAAPSGKYIYVLNHDTSTVVDFAVGTDGKLYPQHTYNTATASAASSFPVSASVDPSGAFLYVICTYQPGFGNGTPGPGSLLIYPINTNDGSLGTATSVNIGDNPVGVTSTALRTGAANNYVYVVDRETVTDQTGSPTARGVLLTFAHTPGSQALTPVIPASPTLNGVNAGTQPGGIAVDPTARFVYVTDSLSNQLVGYTITNNGLPAAMVNGPFSTSQFPNSVTVDPRGKYLYATNLNARAVSAYAIDQASGNPAAANGSAATQTGANPTCVTIEPALGIYLYTSNQTDQTVSAFQLDSHNGSLKYVQGNPFPASILPTCVVAVANGEHATQVVNLQ